MKIRRFVISLLVFLILVPLAGAMAQESYPELQLVLIRDFGYGGFGKIQGRFTLKIRDLPEDIDKIEYFLDEELIVAINEPPFEYKFHTSNFQDGEHVFSAVGYQRNGTTIEANRITKIFLSSGQAWSDTQRLIVPLLLFTAGLTILGLGIPVLMSRKKDFVIGKYGPAGGAVCPRCELPFSRAMFSPSLLIGKLVHCPHCGKVSIQARASEHKLQEAESRYDNLDPDLKSKQNDRDYIKMLDDSRFED